MEYVDTSGIITLYCYVDETGQDTERDIFVVTVVIPENRDEVLEYIEQVEITGGKGKFKWGRARPDKRYRYMEIILSQRKYPHLKQTSGEKELIDHAVVAKHLSENKLPKYIATMGSKVLADLYGLQVIEVNLQDAKENYTSFLQVARI